eukprot:5456815-Karenia_brevis.AAC.1
MISPHPSLVFPVSAVERQIDKIGDKKGVGPDGIAAEIIKAGGIIYATFLTTIINSMARIRYVAKQWRGGRIVDLWKGKGSTTVASNSRGLLLSDHAAKVFTGLCFEEAEPVYN